ncbi:MAG: hypothetical protein QNK23_17975 [Crocinitomicaceae bacterium]|nr:hypothetical protein [Crocinitomicaceae bacterium]
MKHFLVLLFACIFFQSYGQSFSTEFQSITDSLLKELPSKHSRKFNSILKSRLESGILSRIDTLEFDHLFIKETICYETGELTIIEFYFINGQNEAEAVYVNGEYFHTYNPNDYDWCKDQLGNKIREYRTDRRQLLKKYSKLESVQELAYYKTQLLSIPHVWSEEGTKRFNERRTKELASTFQIQTFINKKTAELFVSIQYAPKKPLFNTVICNSGF